MNTKPPPLPSGSEPTFSFKSLLPIIIIIIALSMVVIASVLRMPPPQLYWQFWQDIYGGTNNSDTQHTQHENWQQLMGYYFSIKRNLQQLTCMFIGRSLRNEKQTFPA
jgi:hypothetical protein